MMSSAATSSPVSASTLAYLMRWPVLRLIWLKLTFSVSDVAGYSATGQVTSERRKNPFQLARGAMGYSDNATDQGPRIPPENRVSSERTGILVNGVNRGWNRDGHAGARHRRSQSPEHHLKSCVACDSCRCKAFATLMNQHLGIEGTMATRHHDQIVETPTEARQAEPGLSVLALLTVSPGLAMLILGVVWF